MGAFLQVKSHASVAIVCILRAKIYIHEMIKQLRCALPWGALVLDPLRICIFSNLIVREKDWRSRARGAKAT